MPTTASHSAGGSSTFTGSYSSSSGNGNGTGGECSTPNKKSSSGMMMAAAAPPGTPTRPRLNSRENTHLGGGTPGGMGGHNHGNSGGNSNSTTTTPNRPRINSRDIPRSYSGMYGNDSSLLPFELARKGHTDWMERNEFWWVYLGGVAIFQLVVVATMDHLLSLTLIPSHVPLYWSWTVTNTVHCVLTILYLHWLKGSQMDDQGEMSAMTLWEQLEGRPHTTSTKRVLTIVPTLLCYAACHFSNYDHTVCVWNCVVWSIHVLGKLPVMNGVRIFGINRTTGIDDVFDYSTDPVAPMTTTASSSSLGGTGGTFMEEDDDIVEEDDQLPPPSLHQKKHA